jgi:PAS domain-containing protein
LDASGYVVSWNTGAERLKGYRADEIIGLSFLPFFTLEDQQDGKPQQLLADAESRGYVEDEGWRVRKDGSRFWLAGTSRGSIGRQRADCPRRLNPRIAQRCKARAGASACCARFIVRQRAASSSASDSGRPRMTRAATLALSDWNLTPTRDRASSETNMPQSRLFALSERY